MPPSLPVRKEIRLGNKKDASLNHISLKVPSSTHAEIQNRNAPRTWHIPCILLLQNKFDGFSAKQYTLNVYEIKM